MKLKCLIEWSLSYLFWVPSTLQVRFVTKTNKIHQESSRVKVVKVVLVKMGENSLDIATKRLIGYYYTSRFFRRIVQSEIGGEVGRDDLKSRSRQFGELPQDEITIKGICPEYNMSGSWFYGARLVEVWREEDLSEVFDGRIPAIEFGPIGIDIIDVIVSFIVYSIIREVGSGGHTCGRVEGKAPEWSGDE